MEDQREILRNERPFSCLVIKGGKGQIFHRGKLVSTVVGKTYEKMLKAMERDDAYELQLFLAKVTGHFKHGNEREGRSPR